MNETGEGAVAVRSSPAIKLGDGSHERPRLRQASREFAAVLEERDLPLQREALEGSYGAFTSTESSKRA